MEKCLAAFEDMPIIAAVKNEKQLEEALETDCSIFFLLFGDICNIRDLVDKIKERGRYVFVHLDLTTGLAGKEIAADFVKEFTKADGIISTRPQLVKRAKAVGLLAILRIFLIDSLAVDNIPRQLSACHPDLIELMPGVIPKVIRRVREQVGVPIIAGGLISDREDIIAALSAGALCVSTTCADVWEEL